MGNIFSRNITQRGKMTVGGLIAAGVVAGGIFLNNLSTDGEERMSDPFPAFLPMVIDVSATGSTSATQKYDAYCGDSPLKALGAGSGLIIRAVHHNIRNPAGASMDVGFVEDCGDKTASGSQLFDNTCTSTGCVNVYTTGTLPWSTASGGKLKVTISKDPTASFDAKLTLWMEDILGE